MSWLAVKGDMTSQVPMISSAWLTGLCLIAVLKVHDFVFTKSLYHLSFILYTLFFPRIKTLLYKQLNNVKRCNSILIMHLVRENDALRPFIQLIVGYQLHKDRHS